MRDYESLFARIAKKCPQCVLRLRVQRRCHPDIIEWSNKFVYEREVVSDRCMFNRRLKIDLSKIPRELRPVLDPMKPIVWLNLSSMIGEGTHYGWHDYGIRRSAYNIPEAIISALITKHLHEQDIPVAVIAPYRLQRDLIRGLLNKLGVFRDLLDSLVFDLSPEGIDIRTVDSFQGRESSVIVLSVTYEGSTIRSSMLSDYRRLNVALTRAKEKLIVVSMTPYSELNLLLKLLYDLCYQKKCVVKEGDLVWKNRRLYGEAIQILRSLTRPERESRVFHPYLGELKPEEYEYLKIIRKRQYLS